MEDARASRLGPRPRILIEPDEADVARELLGELQQHTGAPALRLQSGPTRIVGGYDTMIYAFELEAGAHALDGPLIARIFQYGTEEQARLEAVVHHAIASQDFPAPDVVVDGADRTLLGRPYIVMRRAAGTPMIDSLLGPRMLRMATLLGETQGRLHSLDAEAVRAALQAASIDVSGYPLEQVERLVRGPAPGLAATYDWLLAHRPAGGGTAVCHGDFHPLNVMIDGGAVSAVLDWPNTRLAPPGWDLGAASALFNYAPVSLPSVLLAVAKTARRFLWRRYLRGYATFAALPDAATVSYFETLRLFGFLVETAEARLVATGVIEGRGRPSAFEDERTLRSIVARIEEATGTRPTLPPTAPPP